MDLLVLATAFVLFANPFGRFVVIATRAAGISLLTPALGVEWIFVLFLISSTITTAFCLLLFEKAEAYAERFRIAKKAIGFLQKARERISTLAGTAALVLTVILLDFGTSPIYAAAACALAKTPRKPAIAGLVLGNALSFLALYYFGQAFGKSLVSLATAATITSVLALAAYYLLIVRKAG